MGIRGLTTLTKDNAPNAIETSQLYKLKGQRVAIDASCLIYKALMMIKEGTFGICVTCKTLINKERLEEVPHTTKCFDCKTNR